MKLIIIRGYPGAGKTTLGKRLEHDGFGKFIDHNMLLGMVNELAGDAWEVWGVYDKIVGLELAIIDKLLQEKKDVVVARGFSSEAAVTDYCKVGQAAGAECIIIRVDVEQKELSRRVQTPGRALDYNPVMTPEQLTNWETEHPIEPIQAEIIIDASGKFDTWFPEVVKAIK